LSFWRFSKNHLQYAAIQWSYPAQLDSVIGLWKLGGWFAFIALLLLILFYYEKLGIILSDFYKLLGWTGKYFQKKFVALDIQSRLNLAAKKLNTYTAGLMPYSLEIKWVKPEEVDREAFIRENKAILRMQYYVNQERNFVNVVHDFVSKAHLREPKAYLSEHICRAVDLRLTACYLMECKREETLAYFVANYLRPELIRTPEVQSPYDKLESLDEFGYFTRVLIFEYLHLARRLFPNKAGMPEIVEETSKFLDFLSQFPPRPPGTEIELDFRGKYVKVRFVLVAKLMKITKHGIDPYVNRIAEGLTTFADTAYVCGMGRMIGATARVAKTATDEYGLKAGPVHHYGLVYHGERRSGVCIRLSRKGT
jgi:small subunit ribosomal protein S1